MFPEFQEFKKIPRLSREIIITEKIDGTNGVIFINENNTIYAGSRTRWLWSSEQDEVHNDNMGFAHWVKENKEELLKLGQGFHYGEWWGKGIQRGYDLQEKRFSLFNTGLWVDRREMPDLKIEDKRKHCPDCCYVVPILYNGIFDAPPIASALRDLQIYGSKASPGFMNPEGIVIYHIAGKQYFKKTILNDEKPKGVINE